MIYYYRCSRAEPPFAALFRCSAPRPGRPADRLHGPAVRPLNVLDFAPLAKAKLDPLAWDYLEGGSEDELTLRENREAFNKLIIRPRALTDVHKIDLSLELLGRKLDYPILIDPSGGKNCFFRNGEMEVGKAAANAKALHITNGGIDELLEAGKGPAAWWQVTTGAQLLNAQTMRAVREAAAEGTGAPAFASPWISCTSRSRARHEQSTENARVRNRHTAARYNGRVPGGKKPVAGGSIRQRPRDANMGDAVGSHARREAAGDC